MVRASLESTKQSKSSFLLSVSVCARSFLVLDFQSRENLSHTPKGHESVHSFGRSRAPPLRRRALTDPEAASRASLDAAHHVFDGLGPRYGVGGRRSLRLIGCCRTTTRKCSVKCTSLGLICMCRIALARALRGSTVWQSAYRLIWDGLVQEGGRCILESRNFAQPQRSVPSHKITLHKVRRLLANGKLSPLNDLPQKARHRTRLPPD